MAETIYTQEPGKYYAHHTVGGWVVVYIEDRYNCRNVDGGKVHKSRQNAYKKADRLNHPVKYAMKKYGMAECYFDGDTAVVREGDDESDYTLTMQNAAMPPFHTFTGTLEEIEKEVRNSKFGGSTWQAVKPEEI